jgi:hypothetical protein
MTSGATLYLLDADFGQPFDSINVQHVLSPGLPLGEGKEGCSNCFFGQIPDRRSLKTKSVEPSQFFERHI